MNTCHLRPEHLVAVARVAEDQGYFGCTVADHAVYPKDLGSSYPYVGDWGSESPFPDVWVAIAAMSVATTTLQFMSGIYLAAARPPLVVAKAVATAAIIANYRVAFGVGVGWMKEDFMYLGAEFHNRGARTDELIDLLRKVWTGDWVEHSGAHYQFDAFVAPPAPQGPIPIWGGGDAERPLRRAAHLDGWIAADYNSIDRALAKVARFRGIQREEGIDAEAEFGIMFPLDHPPTRDECQRLQDAGVTAVTTSAWDPDGPSMSDPGLTAVSDGLKRYAEAVVQHV